MCVAGNKQNAHIAQQIQKAMQNVVLMSEYITIQFFNCLLMLLQSLQKLTTYAVVLSHVKHNV